MLPRPVMDVPGDTPRLPVRVVGPVLVTVEAPRTAKLPAEARILVSIRRSSRHSSAGAQGVDVRPLRLQDRGFLNNRTTLRENIVQLRMECVQRRLTARSQRLTACSAKQTTYADTDDARTA